MNPLWLLCMVALVQDTGVLAWVLLVDTGWLALFGWFLVHVATCLLFAFGFAKGLPPGHAARPQEAAVFTFTLAFLLPILGMVFLLVLIAPALCYRGRPGLTPSWQHPRIPELESTRSTSGMSDAPFNGRNLDAILHNAPLSSTRMAAVMGTLKLPDAQAVSVLRMALKDRDEEVRLLAYALLNRKEKAIEARIHARQIAMDSGETGQGYAQHKGLAHEYWELDLLSPPQGGAASPLLTYAGEHARATLALQPLDAGMHLLLGRILLRQKQFDAADMAFGEAERVGLELRHTQPYRAEIAFFRQRCNLTKPTGSATQTRPTRARSKKPANTLKGVRHGTVTA